MHPSASATIRLPLRAKVGLQADGADARGSPFGRYAQPGDDAPTHSGEHPHVRPPGLCRRCSSHCCVDMARSYVLGGQGPPLLLFA